MESGLDIEEKEFVLKKCSFHFELQILDLSTLDIIMVDNTSNFFL